MAVLVHTGKAVGMQQHSLGTGRVCLRAALQSSHWLEARQDSCLLRHSAAGGRSSLAHCPWPAASSSSNRQRPFYGTTQDCELRRSVQGASLRTRVIHTEGQVCREAAKAVSVSSYGRQIVYIHVTTVQTAVRCSRTASWHRCRGIGSRRESYVHLKQQEC